MRKMSLIAGFATFVLLILMVALASESIVLSDFSGESMYGRGLVAENYSWKSAPENPGTVYVSVLAPSPLANYIKGSIAKVIRSHNLNVEFVEEPMNYDLKGRIVAVYIPCEFRKHRVLYQEYGVCGILYYSYPGDAKTFTLLTSGKTLSEENIEELARALKFSSIERLMKERISNQTVGVAYWWNLKAKVGKLKGENPYEMIANEIASQLDNFIKSDESNEP